MLHIGGDEFKTFFDWKEAVFLAINEDCNYHLIEVLARSFDDVEMSVCDRIERTWADGALHEGNASKERVSYPFSEVSCAESPVGNP